MFLVIINRMLETILVNASDQLGLNFVFSRWEMLLENVIVQKG